jgi:hypothetical protein
MFMRKIKKKSIYLYLLKAFLWLMKSQRGDSYDNNYVYGYIYEYTNDYALSLCSWLCPKAMPSIFMMVTHERVSLGLEGF